MAVGLLLTLVLFLCFVVVAPAISKWGELNEKKNTLARRYHQYLRILAEKDAIVDKMGSIKEQVADKGYFTSEQTEALSSAELQELIKKVIVDSGGQLSSTQALPVKNKDRFSLITVSVRMTGNPEVLRGVLYRLETSVPFIVIDQLDIRPMRGRRNSRTRQLEPSNDMNINFQAVSFMRKRPL